MGKWKDKIIINWEISNKFKKRLYLIMLIDLILNKSMRMKENKKKIADKGFIEFSLSKK